jgi:hypothetical protein
MTKLIPATLALVAAAGCAGVPAPLADRVGSPDAPGQCPLCGMNLELETEPRKP